MRPARLERIPSLLRQICLLGVFLLLAGCAPRFRTAAWVIRYDLDTPAEIEEICRAAQAAGIDELLVQIRGRGDALYRSSVAPRAGTLRDQPDSFDPLAAIIDSCQGLAIHAWLNVYYLWSADPLPQDPAHPAHPDHSWFLHDADGRSVAGYSELERALGWIEGVYADPASPEYRRLFLDAVREIIERYPVAGIHLDFVRYPGYQYGQTGPLGEQFQEEWAIDPRYLTRELHQREIMAWLHGRQEPADRLLTTANILWNERRSREVTELVREIREVARRYGPPGLKVSAAIFPDPLSAFLEKGQDWTAWSDHGLVDALYPMAYFGEPARVGRQLGLIARLPGGGAGGRYWAGLGAYIKTPGEIGREARLAREAGYDGIGLFSLGHLLKKPGQAAPYTAAIAEAAAAPPLQDETRPEAARSGMPSEGGSSLELLKKLCADPTAGCNLPPEGIAAVFQERLQEFRQAGKLFAAARQLLKNRETISPPWATVSGVFRYIHPFDSEQRRQEQREICETARTRLKAGEEMAAVARELSQGGSKELGGRLGRRFFDATLSEEQLLAGLSAGEVSPVIEAENGCWSYRIEETGPPAELPYEELPWPARRILFRQTISRLLAEKSWAP